MESEAMRLVCDFLLKEGTTWDALSKSEKKLFEKVVPVIQQRLEGLEQAEAMRRENAINQSSISTAIGVARKTVCTNNPLVAKFINGKVLDQEIIAQDFAVKLHLEQERIAQKDIQIHNLEEENAKLRAEIDKYRHESFNETSNGYLTKEIPIIRNGTKHKN